MEIEEIWEKTIEGQDLTGFWLQVGFVEGVIADAQSFKKFETAYQHIFRRNKEFAIFLWNGIPVRLSYIEDIPNILNKVIDLLSFLQSEQESLSLKIEFSTNNLHTYWAAKKEGAWVDIESNWHKINGKYETALNQVSLLRMPIQFFLWEWKLLLEQCIKAFEDSNSRWTNKKISERYDLLKTITRTIDRRGRFYRYEERSRDV